MYVANEKDEQLVALIYRSGDINHKSTVRCYTRQGSAQVMMDYKERPNTDDSVVVFLPGKLFLLELEINVLLLSNKLSDDK